MREQKFPLDVKGNFSKHKVIYYQIPLLLKKDIVTYFFVLFISLILENDVQVDKDEDAEDFVVIDDAGVIPEIENQSDPEAYQPTLQRKPTKECINWSKELELVVPPLPDKVLHWGKVNLENISVESEPIDVFLAASKLETLVVNVVVPQTNLYANQSGVVFETSKEEVMCFLGVNYLMGYHQLPTMYNYWSAEPDITVPFVAENMTRDRFRLLRSNLHFNDNTQNLPKN